MSESQKVRTRFAPSPTGFVHIGSLRAALFAFLFARHHGGVNVLRVEDTDQTRKIEGAIENMLRVMHSVGVDFDEGPYLENGVITQRGGYGPYIQSERLAIYQKHAQELVGAKKAYYCFCSEERLTELRTEQVALKQPPMYDKHCRNLPFEEVERLLQEFANSDQRPVIRQMIPLEGVTVNHDLVYGDITYDHKTLDDQVLLKSDGFPTYHLAVVVDDHNMGITHVVRGDDWLPSTPKHILLYKDFGWDVPFFAHAPLILNPDKSKLSKRQGDVAVEDYLQKGYLPEAIINFVAFLGWNPKTEQEIFSMPELIEQFDLVKINKSGAVFDSNKLDWMNSTYIRMKTVEELTELCLPYFAKQGVIPADYKKEYLQAVVNLEQERLKKLSDITDATEYFFADPEYDPSILVWKKSDAADAKVKLAGLQQLLSGLPEETLLSKELIEIEIKKFIADNGNDNGSVLWPLRVALTGLPKSPGPFEVASTLALGWGREVLSRRLKKAIEYLS